MKRAVVVMALCVGCGDDAPNMLSDAGVDASADAMYCDTDAGTTYEGPVVTCAGGAGVCLVVGAGEACFPRCVGVLRDCQLGYYARLIHVGDGTECICKPPD